MNVIVPFLEACEIFRNSVRVACKNHIGTYIEIYNETMGMPIFASKAMICTSQKEYMAEFEETWKLEPYIYKKEITEEKYKKLYNCYKSQDLKAKFNREFSKEWVENQYTKQGGKCFTCRKQMGDNFTLDRIDNFMGHIENNMLLTCKECNVARKNKSIYLQEHQNKLEM